MNDLIHEDQKKKNHTANRLYESYTELYEFSTPDAADIIFSVIQSAADGGKAEYDDMNQILIQVINLDDCALIPKALILRHSAHLQFRKANDAKVFTQENLRALDVINSQDRKVVSGADAFKRHIAYWKAKLPRRDQGSTDEGGENV